MMDEASAAVKRLHAEGLCNSPYETLPAAIEQNLEVVHTMRDRAQSIHRFDLTLCPMRSRVVVLEQRLGIGADAPLEAGGV